MRTHDRWRVSVDPEVCVSSANCVDIAKGRFALTGDGARPVDLEIDPDDDVVEAADACPMQAIRIVRVGTDQVIAP
ncbi:MAG: ferredoxin [Catenulispora sp.]|nr:ferredoxin [Catenulispora sp.]